MSPPRTISAALSASLAFAALLHAPAARADNPPPAAPPAPAAPPGPVVELAPEDRAPPAKPPPIISLGAGRAPDEELVRGLAEQRFRSAMESIAHTSVGGYGELTVTGAQGGTGSPRVWTADARRLVLFVAHSFTKDIRVYTELELEHASEAEIEQAFVDWKVVGDYLGLRAGLILVPMGITNELHEPPVFLGVNRPSVETVVIPSTWREIGAGFFGHPTEMLRYQLYAMAAVDPLGFTSGGFVNAKGQGMLSRSKAWAAVGRVEVEPVLGLVIGASGYAGDAGRNGSFYRADRSSQSFGFPMFGYSLDARLRRAGVEAKVLFTEWRMPNAGQLMGVYDASGNLSFPDPTKPVPTVMRGGYVELGYDVFHPAGLSHQLVPFVRGEAYDTQAAVPQGFTGNPTYHVNELTFGANYRPIREVVVKADYQLKWRPDGPNESAFNAGIGFMY